MLRTFTGTGYDTWKELDGEMVILRPVCGLSSPSTTLTLVPDIILAFFLGGAAAAVVILVLGFNMRCFWFLTSGIVFDGNMSAILDRFKLTCTAEIKRITIPLHFQFWYHCCPSPVSHHHIHPRKQKPRNFYHPYQYQLEWHHHVTHRWWVACV